MCELVSDNLSDDLLWFADDVGRHKLDITTYQHGRIVQMAAMMLGSIELMRGLFAPKVVKGERMKETPNGELICNLFGVKIIVRYDLSRGLSQVDWELDPAGMLEEQI